MDERWTDHQTRDKYGCGFGQVTRERIDNAVKGLTETKRLVQWVIGIALVQLLVFAAAAFWFVANRAIP